MGKRDILQPFVNEPKLRQFAYAKDDKITEFIEDCAKAGSVSQSEVVRSLLDAVEGCLNSSNPGHVNWDKVHREAVLLDMQVALLRESPIDPLKADNPTKRDKTKINHSPFKEAQDLRKQVKTLKRNLKIAKQKYGFERSRF